MPTAHQQAHFAMLQQAAGAAVVGTFRTFGPDGPAYQILAIDDVRETAHIRVLHSGEELEAYPLAHVAQDPEAA